MNYATSYRAEVNFSRGIKTIVRSACAAAIFALASGSNAFASQDGWVEQISSDGKVTVKSKLSTRNIPDGGEAQVVEYVAKTSREASYEGCVALLKDVSKHKLFLDEEETRAVKPISENEWLIYYYSNPMWPISDSDTVAIMNVYEDEAMGLTVFTITSAPSMMDPVDGMPRLEYYNMIYSFTDMGDGKVGLTVSAKVSPAHKIPEWMVRMAFPEAVNDMIKKIFESSKTI